MVNRTDNGLQNGAHTGAPTSPPALALARHRLVWPTASGWAVLQGQVQADETAHAIVQHWHDARLPLVVSRQPDGLAPGLVALGLPAPLKWSRRRLTLQVAHGDLSHSGAFPRLAQVARRFGWRLQGLALERQLAALDVQVQVFGSHGWQVISGLPCLRESSDLDLRIEVAGIEQADAVVALLAAATLPCRIDGELVFGEDHAVAWREFAQLRAGATRQVLCKRLRGIELLTLEALQPLATGTGTCTRIDAATAASTAPALAALPAAAALVAHVAAGQALAEAAA